jgi:AcrR family transcriptional regulator
MSKITTTSNARESTRPPTTRERILVAALDLFIERGVDGTTVSAIERAVGLAAGTGSFYRHFASKEEVLVASFEYGIARLIDEMDSKPGTRLEAPDSVEGRTRHYRELFTLMARFDPLRRLLVAERDRYPELDRLFTEMLKVDSWDLPWPENPSAIIAMAALTGFYELAQLGDGPYRDITPDEFIAALVELITPTKPRRR